MFKGGASSIVQGTNLEEPPLNHQTKIVNFEREQNHMSQDVLLKINFRF